MCRVFKQAQQCLLKAKAAHTWSVFKLLCATCAIVFPWGERWHSTRRKCYSWRSAPLHYAKPQIISTLTSVASELSKCTQWGNSWMWCSQRRHMQAEEVLVESRRRKTHSLCFRFPRELKHHITKLSWAARKAKLGSLLLHALCPTSWWAKSRFLIMWRPFNI